MKRLLVWMLAVLVFGSPVLAASEPLRVATTVTTLASLAREIGGDEVEVTVFAKPGEDPHFVDPRPSFVKALSRADALVVVGMDLESGWVPPLVQNARNAKLLVGAPGYIDASTLVTPLGVPAPGTSRLAGDVHSLGNPHYLMDPIQGLRVAELLRNRLSEIRPASTAVFERRYRDLEQRVAVALFGETLVQRYDYDRLARLQFFGKLGVFLRGQGELDDLGGWTGRLFPYTGARVVADHNLWPYFCKRFGLREIGWLEPKPGVPPTTGHLSSLIGQMRAQQVRVILAAPYFPPRHAEFVARETGARIAHMAHDVGAMPGTGDYISLVDYDVNAVAAALGGGSE